MQRFLPIKKRAIGNYCGKGFQLTESVVLMHGLWKNIKTSVEETLETIILSPKKLRKKFAENKQDSTLSEQSGSSDREFQDLSIKKNNNTSSMYKGYTSNPNNEEKSEKSNIEDMTSTTLAGESFCDKEVEYDVQETGCSVNSNGSLQQQVSINTSSGYTSNIEVVKSADPKVSSQPDPCHMIGDHNKTEISTIRLSSSANIIKGGDTSNTTITPNFMVKPKPSPPRRTNTLGYIDIELINDEGETECVDIDIADIEVTKDEDKYLRNTRRQSISDRINRRRTSELAAEIIRLSAEHRKKEFADLLNEHEEIVQNIEIWKATGVLPPTNSHKKSTLETVDDEDFDDIMDEEPAYFRQINDNASFYLSSNRFNQDNKENKTLPRSH